MVSEFGKDVGRSGFRLIEYYPGTCLEGLGKTTNNLKIVGDVAYI
jgi:hypothetical protein